MAGMSKIPNTALLAAGACFATSIYIAYLLLRKADEDLYEGREPIKSSRHTVIEVLVPSEIIGGVIGRNGSNIAKIQETTSTRINFRDEVKGSTNRVAIIRGKPNDAQAAERLIRSAVAERMNITSLELHVPIKACGYIIGKNGTNVRMIRDVSKAKIQMDTSCRGGDLQQVTITGTKEEIEIAKALIEEDVDKAMRSRQNKDAELSTANRMVQFHGKQLCINSKADTDSVTEKKPQREELIPSGKDGFLEVWVSYITSPSQFWVQPVREECTVGLDKLTDEMTSFYGDQSNDEDYTPKEVNVSDLVAAPFTHDSDWYRARVISVEEDEYDVENSQIGIYYVDFGEENVWKKGALRSLRDDFKQLPFQATECELADVQPKRGETTWSVEAIKAFDQLSYCSLWKKIMLKVLRETPNGVKVVELIDVLKDTDVNVANELVQLGLAEHVRPQEEDH